MSDLHILESKLEEVAEQYIANVASVALSAIDIHKGFETEDLELPYISIMVQDLEPLQVGGTILGNAEADLVITLKTHKEDTTRSQHKDLEGDLVDIFYNPNLANLLHTQSEELGVLQAIPSGKSRDRDENTNETELTISTHILATNETNSSITPAIVGTAIIG